MRNSIAYLIFILLLSTTIAKASTISSKVSSPILKSSALEQKIDVDDEKPITYEQLKNDEFMSPHHHNLITIASRNLLFTYLAAVIPSSYLKIPKRPPQEHLF